MKSPDVLPELTQWISLISTFVIVSSDNKNNFDALIIYDFLNTLLCALCQFLLQNIKLNIKQFGCLGQMPAVLDPLETTRCCCGHFAGGCSPGWPPRPSSRRWRRPPASARPLHPDCVRCPLSCSENSVRKSGLVYFCEHSARPARQ